MSVAGRREYRWRAGTKRTKSGGGLDAVTANTIEEACHGVNQINQRKRREREGKRAEAKRAAITLPTLDTLRKLMED